MQRMLQYKKQYKRVVYSIALFGCKNEWLRRYVTWNSQCCAQIKKGSFGLIREGVKYVSVSYNVR